MYQTMRIKYEDRIGRVILEIPTDTQTQTQEIASELHTQATVMLVTFSDMPVAACEWLISHTDGL